MEIIKKGNTTVITCGPPQANPCPKCGHKSRKA